MNPRVIELRIYPDKNEKLTIPSEYRSDVLYGANENHWLSRYTVKTLCRMIELQHLIQEEHRFSKKELQQYETRYAEVIILGEKRIKKLRMSMQKMMKRHC